MSDKGLMLKVRVPHDISASEYDMLHDQLENCVDQINNGKSTFIMLSSYKSNGVDYDYDVEVVTGSEGKVEIVRSLEE